MVCWVGNTDKTQLKVIDDIIRRAGKLIKKYLPTVDAVYESRVRQKLKSLWNDKDHPLFKQLSDRIIQRSGRLRPIRSNTNRYRSSFLGTAITFHNLNFIR